MAVSLPPFSLLSSSLVNIRVARLLYGRIAAQDHEKIRTRELKRRLQKSEGCFMDVSLRGPGRGGRSERDGGKKNFYQ